MFSKYSRYRKLPDVITTDPKGRMLASKQLRLTPDVDGVFRHTLAEGDRLDHLAYKYYRQTRSWWRICDAEPDELSPQGLLGREPVATVRLPVSWAGLTPPWSDLLKTTAAAFGVDSARLGPAPLLTFDDGDALFDLDPGLVEDLDAAVHTQALSPDLAGALAAGGLTISGDLTITTVRPEEDLWRITEDETAVYTVRFFEGAGVLSVYASAVQQAWTLTVVYNAVNTTPEALAALAETLGFVAETPVPVERVGKQIAIPARALS